MSNIYYHPEDFGLQTIGEIDNGGGYDFDTFVIWQDDSTGRLWCASDSGCSCPVPFEDVTFADGMREIRTVAELHDAVTSWCSETDYRPDATDADVGALIIKAREAMR